MIIILILLVLVIFLILYKLGSKFTKQEDEEFFKKKRLEYGVPERSKTVNYLDGDATIKNGKNYIWSNGEKLFFFPAMVLSEEEGKREYKKREIPISFINSVQFEKPSEKNTLIDNIESDTGERVTIVDYYVNAIRYTMAFEETDYHTFMDLISPNTENSSSPEQEQDVQPGSTSSPESENVQEQPKSDVLVLEEADNENALQKLKELAKLKQDGILTEEEFAAKKQELLNRI